MANGSIKVLRAVPGSTSLGPILTAFCRKPEGTVTAFSDAALPIARRFVGEDHPVEVKPFGEFVRAVLELAGEPAMRLAGSAERTSAIAQACQALDEESPFHRTRVFPGLHTAILRTLRELNEWGIDASEMEALSERTPPRLAEILRSLAQIDRSSSAVLASLGRESHAQQLQASLDCVPDRDGGFDRVLVIAGSDESPLKLKWLQWLANQGSEITIVFDRHATDATLFAGAERAVRQLGIEPVISGEGTRLTRNLFASQDHGGPEIEVSIESSADPLAEVEWALRSCMEADDPSGCAIYARNLVDYAPLIEAAAKRLEVPLRISRRAPLLTNAFARLSLSTLEALAGSDVRALGSIVKSSYLQLGVAEQNLVLSGLREAHAARAAQWEELRHWAERNAESHPWMLTLLDWRRKAIGNRYPLRDWSGLIRELVNSDALPWAIKRQQGHPALTARDLRARNQLERLLSNHISIDAATVESLASLADVSALCRRLWSAADVSLPSSEFGVLVTDQVEALTDADRLHVLGMLEGVFPRRRSEEPILCDADRAIISGLRPHEPALLDSHATAAAERDIFYRVCCAARRVLVCSYPQADDQQDNIPAFYLTEVQRAAGDARRRDHPRLQLAPVPEACTTLADQVLRRALDAPRELPDLVELRTAEAEAALRPSPDAAFSPAELRDALECPFRHAFRDRLHVAVRRTKTRWQNLRKLPQAAGLILQPTREAAESALLVALDAELDSLYSEVDAWELQLLRFGGQRLVRDWLRREFRARDTWRKVSGSVRSNVAFGDPEARGAMPDGVTLRGIVPGISRTGNYRVAHLFSNAAADPGKLTDPERLYLGLHFLSIHQPGSPGALEVDTINGNSRQLYVIHRGGGPLNGYAQDGLSVATLSDRDDPIDAERDFYEKVRKHLRVAATRIRDARVDPIQSEACVVCEYGELCRRSKEFGEEDSPFGRDLLRDDV